MQTKPTENRTLDHFKDRKSGTKTYPLGWRTLEEGSSSRLVSHTLGLHDRSLLLGRLLSAAVADLPTAPGVLPVHAADSPLPDRSVVRHRLRFLTVSSSNL